MEFFDIGIKPMRLGLAVYNSSLEKWLEKEVESRALVGKIGDDETEFNYDGIIILRKNRNGGANDPLAIVKKFTKSNPKGFVLFIAGVPDDEAKETIRHMKKLAARVFVVDSPLGNIGEKEIRKGLSDMQLEWEIFNANVYLIYGAKGGCGTTTITAHLANYLSTKGSVAVFERRPGLKHHKLNPGINVQTKDPIYTEDIREMQITHHFVLLDSTKPVDNDQKSYCKSILVMDSSPESIDRAKVLSADHVVLTHFCPTVLPKEVVEKEINKNITLVIECDRPKFLTSLATGEQVIPDIEKLE